MQTHKIGSCAALCLLGALVLPPAVDAVDPEAAACPPNYAYCGFTLPLPPKWGTVSPVCTEGNTQSPVVLRATKRERGEGLRFDYRRSPMQLANSGHDFRAAIPADVDDLLFVPGDPALAAGFRLEQFHFHVPREHRLPEKSDVVGELHLVHDRGGHTVVVALFLRLGRTENPALAPIFDKLPLALCDHAGVDFDPAALLATARGDYYAYTGSLTTPPCTEGVDFYVYPKPLEIGPRQLEKLSQFGPNARPVQRNSNVIRYVNVAAH